MKTKMLHKIMILLFILCLAQIIAGEPVDKSVLQTTIDERFQQNPAWRRAQQDPPFSSEDEAGFATDPALKQQQRRAAATLWDDLQRAYAAGQKSFRIAPGQYRFTANQGLTITGWEDFEIHAENATFWFERDIEQLTADPKGLNLVNCRNVNIEGLSIDFDPPVYIQAVIKKITADNSEFIAQIDPAWPKAAVPAGQFSIYTESGEYVPQQTFLHAGAELLDDELLRIKVNPDTVRDNFNRDLLRYTSGRGLIKSGCYIALNFRRGRSIGLIDCEAIALENINVYQSPGMGILENGGPGGHTYRNMRLIRKPGTRRVHYGTADHLHSNRMSRGPRIIACEFAHSSDDNINLHGNWSYVWRQLDPQTVVIGTPDPLETSGLLTFYDRVEMTPQGQAHIVCIEPLEAEPLLAEIEKADPPQNRIAHRRRNQLKIVTLDRAVATAAHSVVDPHMNHADGFLIKDCYFHDSRSRGILLSGARNGTVQNNIWQNELAGINIYEESWGYAEGAIPQTITVEHNMIINCGWVVPSGGITVGLVPGGRQGLRRTRVIRDIRIEDNLLVNGGFLTVLYTDGGTVRNNVLIEPLHYMRTINDFTSSRNLYGQHAYFPRPRTGPLSIWSSRNIRVSGNKIYLSGRPLASGPVDIGDFTEKIVTEENKILQLPGSGGLFEINE